MPSYFKDGLTNTKLLVAVPATGSFSPNGFIAVSVSQLSIQNPGLADAYIQMFDAAAAADVTLGTTAPVAAYWVPAEAARLEQVNLRFARGLVIAATTTASGSSAPTTALVVERLEYA